MNTDVPEGAEFSASEARWPKVVAVLIVVLFIAAVTIEVVVGERLPNDFEASVAEDLGLLVAFGAFVFTGAVLVAKRPRNVVSWMVLAVGLMPSVFQPFDTYGSWTVVNGQGIDPLGTFGFWTNEWYWWLLIALVTVFLPMYFPDGRLPTRRWRPWALIPILSTAVLVVAGMLQPTVGSQTLEDVEVDNPIGITWMPGPEDELGFIFIGILLGIVLAVAAVTVRFRRSLGAERQQLKVFLFAASLLLLLPMGEVAPSAISDLMFSVIITALPIAIAFAVLRYRLYGIDRVISRTVSYALLTAVLAGIYALGVVGIGELLPGESSDLLVAGSTLAVAAMFQPLRARIQTMVDRRFNRARYDASRIVNAFSSRLRDQVDLGSLTVQLRDVAQTTLQPQGVSVWIRDVAQ